MLQLLRALVTWDFAVAFLPVAHQALWLTAALMKLLLGLANVLKGMYWFSSAWSADSSSSFFFLVTREVLQGCPLSGMLLAWVLDPFLSWMAAAIDIRGGGTTKACADDVGCTVRHLSVLFA